MKRQRVDVEAIAGWDNLWLALWKASRGKRGRPDVSEFLEKPEARLSRLRMQLLENQLQFDDYRCFQISDPKPRDIVAVSFELRVVHHAVMNLIGGSLERSQIENSYACLPGKGVHAAIVQVQRKLRRTSWYVKIDIQKYFEHIDHECLLNKLERRFKGEAFFDLIGGIIGSYQTQEGKGLPIGSLTSQYFANFYLEEADRYIQGLPEVTGYVRYMDDMIWFCYNKADAVTSLRGVVAFLEGEMLKVKPQRQIQPCNSGVSYCGYRILPFQILLSRRKKRAYKAQLHKWQRKWEKDEISSLVLQQASDAVHALTLPAQSRGFRQFVLAQKPEVDA